ncbi:LysR family transcriptional regulator [Rhizobium chutanense]
MSLPLDLDLPRTFVAVVESGHLSNAALPAGRSQSAVSML